MCSLRLLAVSTVLFFSQCTSARSTEMMATQGSAIVGLVTPDEIFLFTDSARSTISPAPGSAPQLIDHQTTKAWKVGQVIFAQAGLRTIAIHGRECDFTDAARYMLGSSVRFDPVRFSTDWKAEIRRSLREAADDNPARFAQLVSNGVKAVELVVGWFDQAGTPHLKRLYIEIKVSAEHGIAFEDHDSEIQGTEAGRGSVLLGAEAADIAPELDADRAVYDSLTALMAAGRYPEAANLIIGYAAQHSSEVGGPVQMVTLRKAAIVH